MGDYNFHDLHKDVCFKRANDQIIWQPRIGCWMDDKLFGGGQLPQPYTGMDFAELYRSLNCSARLYIFNDCFKKIYPSNVSVVEKQVDPLRNKVTITCPAGKVTRISLGNNSNYGRVSEKWFIENETDMKIYTWIWEHTDWIFDKQLYKKLLKQYGDLGAPTIFMPRVSVQNLYIDVMGVEKGIFALYDFPDTVEKYFTAMHEAHMRMIKVINDSPIDIINFGDNLHCGTLTPNLFTKYVLKYYQERCELLHKGNNFVSSHWDGDTKTLLPFAKETGLDGIEAITPIPQGDVTLEEVRKHLGDDIFLLDGIPAILFDEIYTEKELEKITQKVIDLFAPNLILGISDEISSTGDIERVRMVGDIVDKYNMSISKK